MLLGTQLQTCWQINGRVQGRSIVGGIDPKRNGPLDRIHIITDSDHTGCRRTTKKSSSVNKFHGIHCIKTVLSTHSTVALPSPESEHYVLTKWVQPSFWDSVNGASSGICLARQRGLGRARRVSARSLWLQHKVPEKAPDILKVVAKQNPADACAKCVAVKRLGMSQALRMTKA